MISHRKIGHSNAILRSRKGQLIDINEGVIAHIKDLHFVVVILLKKSSTELRGFRYMLLTPEAGKPMAITLLVMYARSRLKSELVNLNLFYDTN